MKNMLLRGKQSKPRIVINIMKTGGQKSKRLNPILLKTILNKIGKKMLEVIDQCDKKDNRNLRRQRSITRRDRMTIMRTDLPETTNQINSMALFNQIEKEVTTTETIITIIEALV